MRPLSEATSRVTGNSFGRKYVALGRILSHWKDIVGAELAHKAQPAELHYRKAKEAKTPTVSLDIATSGADATLLHYQKDLILERINQIFGERWVQAIRFVQVSSNEPRLKPRKTRTPLTGDEKNHLSSMLAEIQDDEIRRTLEGLGTAVMQNDKQKL